MKKRLICFFLCLVLLAGLGSAFASMGKLSEFEGKSVGVLTGSVQDQYVSIALPDVELKYFDNDANSLTALMAGAIDGYLANNMAIPSLLKAQPELDFYDEPLYTSDVAIAFPQSDRGYALRDKMNEYLAGIRESGELQRIIDKWIDPDAADYAVDMSSLSGENGTLVMATDPTIKPFDYYYMGEVTGIEPEILSGFCREYGYALDIRAMDFGGILPGLADGKYDLAANMLFVTEERKQSVCFSDPVLQLDMLLAVRSEKAQTAKEFMTLADFNTEEASIGMMTGMVFDDLIKSFAPKAQVKYFNTISDLIYALQIGQIDAYIDDEPMCRYRAAQVPGLAVLEEPIGEPIGIAFVVGNSDFDTKLLEEFNTFLAGLKSDGTFDEIHELWYSGNESKLSVSVPAEGKNGTVRLAASPESPPMCFLLNGEIVGAEIDMIARFCTEYGYALEIDNVNFDALVPSVASGRYDMANGYLSVTEERKEFVRFTDPYMSAAAMLAIRGEAEEDGFWDGIRESFRRTFITEDRWKLIVEGIGTTLLISVCAAVLGTLLGFGLCLLRRMDSRLAHGFTTVYIRILQGTPILVLLMILFYIVFAKAGMSGVTVAVIAFAMNFAAYVCEMFRTGIDGVDRGQSEAALAIGFTRRQTFFRIVLPQAAQQFLPVYKGEFISLVKMTSVVGYIAVQDLTKMSDIIRSRTYEAFFPLIATAIIYFILAALLTGLLKLVELRIEPDRKNRTVKGVTMQ